jgi:endonuclease-3
MTKEEKVKEIIKRLDAVYKHPHTALYHNTPFQLLIATMLSAQTTDKLVNTLTPTLFKKFPDPHAFAQAEVKEIDGYINKVNFHNTKAKNILAAAKIISEKYKGEIPRTVEELTALPGVGRKTANVVLGNSFNIATGIVVDTHVKRLSRRLGLTDQSDPEKIEQDLMKIVPKDRWIDFSHLLINFGREYCPARPHKCDICPLGDLCPDNELSLRGKHDNA